MLANEETILGITFKTYHRACQPTDDLNLHKEGELSIEWIVFIQDFKSAKNRWSQRTIKQVKDLSNLGYWLLSVLLN